VTPTGLQRLLNINFSAPDVHFDAAGCVETRASISRQIPCAPNKFPARVKNLPALSRREFARKSLDSQMFSRRMFAKKG
jgi:hypothetical protein